MATTQKSAAEEIVDKLGGPANIKGLSHCATRLRFELIDGSKVDEKGIEAIPVVMGGVPQSGDRYQVVIGGAVQTVYNQIQALPSMKGGGAASDADIKAAARSQGPRGKVAWLDSFFEFLADSFRPILGALLGASLIITFMALMSSLGVIGNWADPRVTLPPGWQFINLMWQSVFYFLPLMVAYNASKKIGADPWVGTAIMGMLLLPGFSGLASSDVAYKLNLFGSEVPTIDIFGVPLLIRDYGSQVFPPLLMAGVLGPLYKGLKRIIPENVQLIFVPFLALVIMLPLTAFLIGPIGIFVGAGLGSLLSAINTFSPLVYAIIIPLAYPFMVPLGLHWPINAIMLANIASTGSDFIQGPMGAWNFACFGATAGVLFLAAREKDATMKQTATGALAAGLLGGISEPSLYGIHLRFKRIYPRMLVGCLVGGVIIGIGGGLTTNAFVFTSLLTIPAFSNIPLYAIAIAAAFFTSMILVIVSDYRTPEQKAEALAQREASEAADAEAAAIETEAALAPVAPVAVTTHPVTVLAPVAGHVVALDEVNDKVFSSRTLGEGVGIVPSDGRVVSPVDGVILTVPKSGHAFGIKSDGGAEVLVHVGIDTVRLKGENFTVAAQKGQHVKAGDLLVEVNFDGVREAGYDTTTLVTVTNTKAMGSVVPKAGQDVAAGDPIIDVTP